MEFSKSDESEVTGPSEVCYHSVMSITQEEDKWTANTAQGADQLEYTALEFWFSETIGRVWVRVRAGELDFQYRIDPWEPSRCFFRQS